MLGGGLKNLFDLKKIIEQFPNTCEFLFASLFLLQLTSLQLKCLSHTVCHNFEACNYYLVLGVLVQ